MNKGKVNYVLPTVNTLKELDEEASETWRVYDGQKWKFQLESKEIALKRAKQLGGLAVAYAIWNDEEERLMYMELEALV